MLESNRKGFAVMSSDLKSFSFESENYKDCLKYLHHGDIIAERIPYVTGFGFNLWWFKSGFCKPLRLRKRGINNILWLHFDFHKNYNHKTGRIIPMCEHPKESLSFYHDCTILCKKCGCIISQFGDKFDFPHPL